MQRERSYEHHVLVCVFLWLKVDLEKACVETVIVIGAF